MDYLTSVYRSKMRLFRDRPDVLTAGRWYWCPPGAVVVPYLHRWSSLHYDYDGFELDPGEPGEVEVIPGYTSGVPNARYTGQRWCGPEEYWTGGAPFTARGTPAADPDGVPLCCLETERRGGDLVEGVADQTGVPGPGMLWWPPGLDGLAPGDAISTWIDSTRNGHDGVPSTAPQRPFVDIGPAGLLCARLNRISGLPFAALAAWPAMAAYVVSVPLSAGLQLARPRVTGAAPIGHPPVINGSPGGPIYQDSISTVAPAVPIVQYAAELLSYRRDGAALSLALNGIEYDAAVIDPAGQMILDGCSLTVLLSPRTGEALLVELRIYPFALTDAQHAAVIGDLLSRYQIGDLDELELESGDPLYLHPGDPLILR